MKIVVLDGYTLNPGDLSWEGFRKLGDLKVYDRTSYDENDIDLIIERAKEAQIIFTKRTPLSKEILSGMPNLKYVGILGTGYDVVDINAAKGLGITVTNVPTYGSEVVGQMAIALLLEMCHHVGAHNQAVKEGQWAKSNDWCFWNNPAIELAGKTAGIIGYGRIGKVTGRIAQALGMKVIAYSPHRNEDLEGPTMKYTELEELYRQSDVIFLHCPLFESTRGMINRDSISKMKDGVLIVNNARGSLIVEIDLAEALNLGKVAGAALDVVSSEPIKEDNPLLKARNCIITPHISWAPKESRQRLIEIATDNLEKYLSGHAVNVINL